MRKLRLELDELRVESFHTHPGGMPRPGTVPGFAAAGGAAVGDVGVVPANTLQNTCIIDLCPDSWQSGCFTCAGTCGQDTCNTCFGGATCFGGDSCVTLCADTCPSLGKVCCV